MNNGECLSCADKDDCPMTEMLPMWLKIISECDGDMESIPEDLWDEFSVDMPDIEDGVITWCPMHHEEIPVK